MIVKRENKRILQADNQQISQSSEFKLKDSEVMLRSILEATADGILVVDKNGNVIDANQSFVKMWSIPDALMKTRDDNKLLQYVLNQLSEPEKFLSKVEELYKADVDSFDVINFKDGRVFERYSRPLMINSEVSGRVWSFRDATERLKSRRKLEISEHNYRSIFNSANDTIFVHDKDTGEFLDANRRMSEMYGYSKEEIFKMDVEAISAGVSPYTQKEAMEWIKKASSGHPQVFEWKCKHKNGTLFWVEVNLRLVVLEGADRLLAIVRDIGERKAAEEILKRTNSEMEQRVRERTKELLEENAERKKAEEALEQKNTALREVLGQLEVEKRVLNKDIVANIEKVILPAIKKLKRKGTKLDRTYLSVLEKDLSKLTTSFGGKISDQRLKLTPREIEICNMIKNGLSSKEIAQLINLSTRTIEIHRQHIRTKLGLAHKDVNLTAYLQSLQ